MPWPFAPNEKDIQVKMSKFELARQSGSFIDPSEMDAAGQEALKRLIHGQQPAQNPLAQPPQAPPQQAQQAPPQGAAAAAQNVTPAQGGVWADAENAQRNRALAGVPTTR